MHQRILIATLISAFLVSATGFAQTLVANNSVWRWWHSKDGIDPAEDQEDFHSTFYKLDFDDSKWKTGKDKPGPEGGFGYGDTVGVDLTRPQNGLDRKSAYFRIKFKTEQEHSNLVFKCQRDDAIIVYLDGKEVVRDNIDTDEEEAHDLFALETTSGAEETEVKEYVLKPEVKLAAGEHVLAISLHNREGGSSDLRIAEISLSVKPNP